MAEHKHHQQDLRPGHQHLANRNQEASATPAVLVHQRQSQAGLEHNPWAAEAALEVQVLGTGQYHRHQAGGQHQWPQQLVVKR